MKWKLIEENSTPSDIESINASFDKDVSDEKFTPTVEFAKAVYEKLNKELFYNYLPVTSEVEFELSDDIRGDELGSATCIIYSTRGGTFASDYKLTLDRTAKLTMHSWIGVVLHEMIHLLEYQEHPDRKQDSDYNWHGEWFQNMGDKFKKHGFDLSEFYSGDMEVDDEDERIRKIMNEEMFIKVSETNKGIPEIIKIIKDEKYRCLEYLKDNGIEEVVVLHTNNPMSAKISPMSTKDLDSTPLGVYHLDERFGKKYGPFTEVETINLNNLVLEDSKDYDKEVERIRRQKGVIQAERVSSNAIRIVVS